MTVCIASIHFDENNKPSILAACDRKISLLGGWFSDETAVKVKGIAAGWMAMYAGEAEETSLMLKGIHTAMKNLRVNTFERVVDCCRKAYAKQRRRLVETEILPDYDLKSYSEYLELRKSDKAFYLEVEADIKNRQENWNLLFAGFDKDKTPHLFVISGAGNIQYCDQQRRAAIGIGAPAASIWLAFLEYQNQQLLGDALFAILSAKFFAEHASDVGEETIATYFEPERDFSLVLPVWISEEARRKWKETPLIPKETADALEVHATQAINNYREFPHSLQEAKPAKYRLISERASRRSSGKKALTAKFYGG